jgi:hypothetical protein
MSWSFLSKRTIIYHPNSLNTRNTTTSTKRTIIYHPNRTPWTQEWPRNLQSMSRSFLCSWSSVSMIDDCLFCRCRGLSCVQGVRMIDDCLFWIIYHLNSLNTRKTRTSTKQTIIYHPNRTPWTQEWPRHLHVRFVDVVVFLVFMEFC